MEAMCGLKYTNSELWSLADSDMMPRGAILEDKEGNQIIYTGKAFQIFYTDEDEHEEYIGLCKGDVWTIIDIDEKELES